MTPRSQYGWMALGGLLGLLGLFAACKMREGNRALAHGEPATVTSAKAAPAPSADVPRMLPPISTEPLLPPPPSAEDKKVPTIVPTAAVVPAPSDVKETTTPPPPPIVIPPVEAGGLPTPPGSTPPPPPGLPAVPPAPMPTTPPPPGATPLLPGTTPPAAPTQDAVPPTAIPTPTPPSAPPQVPSNPPVGTDSRPIVIPASATLPVTPPAPDGQPLPPIKEKKESVPPPPGTLTPPPPPPTGVPSVVPTAPTPPVTAREEHPSEPPLAPAPGPVMQYRVASSGESFKSLARKMLGNADRWSDIHKLNPSLSPDRNIAVGTLVRLPGDACEQDDQESLRALPTLRSRTTTRPRVVLPLTGTFPAMLDDRKVMTLPQKILDQLGNCDTVLLSPGSDRCLWLTNQSHLDRLQAKLDKSPARESEVRSFKRLYYAQTVKLPVKEGRLALTDKLASFAGLGHELVLVGIDDHFEIWDASRWRRYTQTKKAVVEHAEE